MGEQPPRDVKRSFLNGAGRLMPVPVPVGDQGRQASGQPPSLWLLCTRWLKWDIERFLARRFNHRWGSK